MTNAAITTELAAGWLTRTRHRRILWAAMLSSIAATALAWGARRFAAALDPHTAYHVAGACMVYIAVLTLATLTYACWYALSKEKRRIVWEGNFGSLTLGTVGVLFSVLPATAIIQKAITLDHLMNVSIAGTALRIDGAISNTLRDLVEPLARSPGLTHVALGDNSGGMIGGILTTQPVLHERGIDTVVIDGKCASSCALLALMFKKRLLAPGGALGFHNLSSITGKDDTSVEADKARVKARLVELGTRPELVDQLFITTDIDWYSTEKARSLGLVNGCWDPSQSKEMPCS